jgi:UDPglucose 6-dehydrogenase
MTSNHKEKIGVVGLWHLGCVLSASWSLKGHPVTGWDENPELVRKLSLGKSPVYEPRLDDILKRHIKKKTLKFTSGFEEIKDCPFVFLAYDTPVLDDDTSDIKPLQNAVDLLGNALKNQAVVIVSSQTPAGTCARFRRELQSRNKTLELACSPENLRLGEAVKNYLNPGRIILGVESDAAKKRILKLFASIPARILTMNLNSAEMVKHGINSFLAMSVTFSNELADLCEGSGADILDVIKGMKSDPRIGSKAYLSPGIGFSGGTLGRDLKVLEALRSSRNGRGSLFRHIIDLNGNRKISIIEKIKRRLSGSLKSRRIGVLGLTYKPGTSTLRRSLPVEIVKLFIENGAEVSVFDPKADFEEWSGEKNFRKSESPENLIRDSEMVVVTTEWPRFQNLNWKKVLNRREPQIIFDAKNCLADLNLDRIGYRYFGTGRS